MPRNKAKHNRVQKLEDENGWTHVIRGPRLPSTELDRAAGGDTTLSKLTTTSALCIDNIKSKHSKSQQHWSEDPLKDKFKDIFESKITSSLDTVIDNALVLGLGSLATANMDSSSMHQLVLFEHWIAFLRTKYTITEICFQDPHFHDNDRVFLTERGYRVVDDPEAYLLLTPETLLFAPYLPWEITHTFLYVACPALFVGNNICVHDLFTLHPKRQAILRHPVIKDFYISRNWESLDGRNTKVSLSRPKHAQWLHDIVVYWPCALERQTADTKFDESNAALRKMFEQRSLDPQRALASSEEILLRAGPGEWRKDGYVFDSDVKEHIQEILRQNGVES